ncbi:MAG: hypothetical protein ACR2KV_10035 [Solirubrobacteraceae bacterium]
MWSRLGRRAGIAFGLVAGLAACGAAAPSTPAACMTGTAAIEQALAVAPGPVRLADGTTISTCIADASGSGIQLEEVGSLLIGTADRLAVRAVASPPDALELGYLIGAARRGAARSTGLAGQLRQRVEGAGALRGAGPASLAALHRGILAGQDTG